MSLQRDSLAVPDQVRLCHMRDAARRAIEIGVGKNIDSLDPNSESALALTRLLEIMGEAARYVSDDLSKGHPEIPWRLISGMRNRIIHKYFDVDFAIVAAVVNHDLPVLLRQIESILEDGA